jgi:hypothetical protein
MGLNALTGIAVAIGMIACMMTSDHGIITTAHATTA